jgi:hypothetical protein
MNHCLGKTAARPGAISFKLGTYFNLAALPTPPAVFGHYGNINYYGVFGNDHYGDCVLAGAAHETMIWTSEVGDTSPFNDSCVLSDYAAITGFNQDDPNSDQGTDMQAAASYRRKTGIIDATSKRHMVDAYVAPQVGDLNEILTAAYLFGAVGFGFQFPRSATAQFDAGKPWSVVSGDPIEGGHYVPIVGRVANGNFLVVTWGRLQEMEPSFAQAFNDESVCYLSLEMLKNSMSPENFDLVTLQSDLNAINKGTAS